MNRRQSYPLTARLTRMNLLVSGTVLLLAALSFFFYDLFSFRQNLIHSLEVEAQIIGDSAVSAVSFNDPQSAHATLATLERSPDVLSAVLTTDGTVFARYGVAGDAEAESHPLAANETDHAWPSGTRVVLAHRIVFQGKTVGIVYIAARFSEIGQRARQYFFIALTILMFCMIAAVAISSISRRLIAQPITELADTALLVSRDRDYAVRADIRSDSSEIVVLIDAFNTMLAQIQERDAALIQARDQLEARVEARTAELKAANRELEAFSYTVAHDLRGPLDAISSIAFLLTEFSSNAEDPNVRPMVEQLKASTANMGLLIDDLLNFARASSMPIESTPVNLSSLAGKIANELSSTDPGRDVKFQIGDTPEVLADPGLMRVVLDNLLRNSWKYTSHHPNACIEFGAMHMSAGGAAQDKLVFFVRDDGAGFDPAHIDRLFQPFQRLHGKNEFTGTGIGLATVQRILARQGGSIWAEGKVERGATFYFTLH
jgi:signal transduction histidine kinase